MNIKTSGRKDIEPRAMFGAMSFAVLDVLCGKISLFHIPHHRDKSYYTLSDPRFFQSLNLQYEHLPGCSASTRILGSANNPIIASDKLDLRFNFRGLDSPRSACAKICRAA